VTLELVAAGLLGLLVVWIVLGPLLRGAPPPANPLDTDEEGLPAEETRRGQALLAIRDLDFDRATGKLSDADYESLKARFLAEALTVLREEEAAAGDAAEALVAGRAAELRGAPGCAACGPRPEPDAAFCSSCGQALARA
jgi:hypothetical protein